MQYSTPNGHESSNFSNRHTLTDFIVIDRTGNSTPRGEHICREQSFTTVTNYNHQQYYDQHYYLSFFLYYFISRSTFDPKLPPSVCSARRPRQADKRRDLTRVRPGGPTTRTRRGRMHIWPGGLTTRWYGGTNPSIQFLQAIKKPLSHWV